MPIKKILYVILFFLIFNFTKAEENLKSIGKFKDWESFILSQDGNKIRIFFIIFMDMDLDILFVHH